MQKPLDYFLFNDLIRSFEQVLSNDKEDLAFYRHMNHQHLTFLFKELVEYDKVRLGHLRVDTDYD